MVGLQEGWDVSEEVGELWLEVRDVGWMGRDGVVLGKFVKEGLGG